jgi:hypothetical protein
MNAKIAVLGSLIGAAALVGVSTDASARSWHRNWKSTACGPSATVIKHNRYGFVGEDSSARSRTVVRERERGGARVGVSVREHGERFGVREHGGRAGINANINVRERGGERAGAQLQGNRSGNGANVTSGRSASPGGSGNATSQTNTGGAGAGSRGAGGGAASPAGGASGGASGGSMGGGGAGGSSK